MIDAHLEAPVDLDYAKNACLLFQRACDYFSFAGWSIVLCIWSSLAAFFVIFLFASHIYLVCFFQVFCINKDLFFKIKWDRFVLI
jgi:hypothetical protein